METERKPKNALKTAAFILSAVSVLAVISLVAAKLILSATVYERAEAKFLLSLVPVFSGDTALNADFSAEYSVIVPPLRNLTDSLSAYGGFSCSGTEAAVNMTLSADEHELPNIRLSANPGAVTAGFPDITKYYIRQPLDWNPFEYDDLDTKILAKTFTAIGKTYFKVIKDSTTLEKGVYAPAGNIKCDMYTIDFTQDAASQLLRSIAKEIRTNNNLSGIISDIFGDYEEILNYLETLAGELRGGRSIFRMTVWIKNGEIIERQFDAGALKLNISAGIGDMPKVPAPGERYAVTIGEVSIANGLRAAAMTGDVYKHFSGSSIFIDIFQFFL
jgi:hypothetical protein